MEKFTICSALELESQSGNNMEMNEKNDEKNTFIISGVVLQVSPSSLYTDVKYITKLVPDHKYL